MFFLFNFSTVLAWLLPDPVGDPIIRAVKHWIPPVAAFPVPMTPEMNTTFLFNRPSARAAG